MKVSNRSEISNNTNRFQNHNDIIRPSLRINIMASNHPQSDYDNEALLEMLSLDEIREVRSDNYELLSKINFWKKLKIRLFGSAFLCYDQKEGWKKSLPLYAFECKKHGMQIEHPTGWKESLICLKCFNEKFSF